MTQRRIPIARLLPLVAMAATLAATAQAQDSDSDGVPDVADPCPVYSNPLPFADNNGDGVPNECQCGDVNQDGFYTNADLTAFSECFGGSGCDPTISDANGNGILDTGDIQPIGDAISGTIPGYTLLCPRRPGGGVVARGFGFTGVALGSAVLAVDISGNLVVSNIGSSGQDGVSVYFDRGMVGDVDLVWDPPSGWGDGSSLEYITRGVDPPNPGDWLELATTTVDASSTESVLDVSMPSSPTTTSLVQVRNGGTLVEQAESYSAAVSIYMGPDGGTPTDKHTLTWYWCVDGLSLEPQGDPNLTPGATACDPGTDKPCADGSWCEEVTEEQTTFPAGSAVGLAGGSSNPADSVSYIQTVGGMVPTLLNREQGFELRAADVTQIVINQLSAKAVAERSLPTLSTLGVAALALSLLASMLVAIRRHRRSPAARP